jgi:hypothetical protein
VAFVKSEKPADAGTSNRLRMHAQLGNPRWPLANTFRPSIQPLDNRDERVSIGDVAARILSRLEEKRR